MLYMCCLRLILQDHSGPEVYQPCPEACFEASCIPLNGLKGVGGFKAPPQTISLRTLSKSSNSGEVTGLEGWRYRSIG